MMLLVQLVHKIIRKEFEDIDRTVKTCMTRYELSNKMYKIVVLSEYGKTIHTHKEKH